MQPRTASLAVSIPAVLLTLFSVWTAPMTRAEIVINEIMYRVNADEFKEDTRLEYVELYNTSSTQKVSLKGWRFDSGIRYTFGPTDIEPGAFLVIAADLNAFAEHYLDVTHVVGPYEGTLSNSGERIRLIDHKEKTIDLVTYADSGMWSRRIDQKLRGYDDWVWESPQDGEGHSLELIQPKLNHQLGQNWHASLTKNGTPGRANSVAVDNVAPLVEKLWHEPAIPHDGEPVTISARLLDEEGPENLTVTAHYRSDGQNLFQEASMTRGEDGTWRSPLPPMPDGTIIQFYITAKDATDHLRVFPEIQEDRRGRIAARQALYMYQVDNAFNPDVLRQPGEPPYYRLIMPKQEVDLLRQLAGISGRGNAYDSHFNITFIASTGDTTEVRYQTSARIRGHGSRSEFPPGLRVSFPSDAPWSGVTDINLNTQQTHSQSLGARIHQLAGMASAMSLPVKVRINGEDWANKDAPQYGCYVHNEVFDSAYIERHFPGEADGGLYRGVGNANLDDRGENIGTYRTLYNKRNNGSEDDYGDIRELIRVLNDEDSTSEAFLANLSTKADLNQWARFFAIDALLCNTEGGLSDGRGDDYVIFRRADGRFILIPYDLDSILGMGEDRGSAERTIMGYGNMPGFRRLFLQPEFLDTYYGQIRELNNTIFNEATLFPVIEHWFDGWVPEKVTTEVKTFLSKRIPGVLAQLGGSSDGKTAVGATLPMHKGYYLAKEAPYSLYGSFASTAVKHVTIAGQDPTVISKEGMWLLRSRDAPNLLHPGINHVAIHMLDGHGDVVESKTLPIWMDNGFFQNVSSDLPRQSVITWKAVEGPYHLNGTVTIPKETTLILEPGVTIFAGKHARLHVLGNLEAKGVFEQPITLSANPADEDLGWNGIHFENSAKPNLLRHVVIQDTVSAAIDSTTSDLTIENAIFERFTDTAINGHDGRLVVRSSQFNGEGQKPMISTSGTALTMKGNRFAYHSGGPIVSITDASEPVRLYSNDFEGGAGSALTANNSKIHLDDNHFGVFAINRPLISTKESALYATRNRSAKAPLATTLALDEDNISNPPPWQHSPWRTTLSNEPPLTTSSRLANITITAPGLTAYRYRLDDTAWSDPIDVTNKKSILSLKNLASGTHQLSVIGRNAAGDWQSEDEATASTPWEIRDGVSPVHLNELLAANTATYAINGIYHDLIELHNASDELFDLTGYSITDDSTEPRKYVFPSGSRISEKGYLTLIADKDKNGPGLRLGFALDAAGETVTLFDPTGAEIDSLTFGRQIPDYALARGADTLWHLCTPSIGTENPTPIKLASRDSVRISEWLSVGDLGQPREFIELTNHDSNAASLGQWRLTDNIANEKEHYRFPPHSFLAPGSATALWATGEKKAKGTELPFKLAAAGEVITLLDASGRVADFVILKNQAAGKSEGRDTSGMIVRYEIPTPDDPKNTVALDEKEALVLDHLRLSEIQFHSKDSGEDYLEFVNTGSQPLHLKGVTITSGVRFVFPEIVLSPHQAILVIENRNAFENHYGKDLLIAGVYEGKLNNSGEKLEIFSAGGRSVLQMTYSDKWYPSADGEGRTLLLRNPNATSLNNRKAWRADEGTPGHYDY